MKVLITLLLIPVTAFGNDRLERFCSEAGGTIVESFTCPKSKLKLGWKFCLSKDSKDRVLFFDGCTGPSGGHTDLFYSSCIKHDYCYHHEPATNGLSQKDCDEQFLENALSACQDASDKKKCENWAKVMYRGLRGFGKLAFNCANYEADYQK